jgi:hypothetical protein
MAETLESLEAEREAIVRELSEVGDMRRGSINEVFRSCGKPSCCCSEAGHPGHGPYYAFTTKVEGKTKTLQLRTGPRLTKLEREVESYKRFRELTQRLLAVNESICDARPFEDPALYSAAAALKKTSRRSSRRRLRRK